MIGSAAADLVASSGSLSVRLKRVRAARNLADRLALLEAVDSAAAYQAASSSAAAPTPDRASRPTLPASQSGRPYTAPRSPGAPASGAFVEDEWVLRRAGPARGGASLSQAPSTPAAASLAAMAGRTGAGAVSARSPILAKANLATGSQAAVVKLASYGAGNARAGALLNYQSQKGELTLEREDGSFVTGKSAVAELAAHWRSESTREPSNDVLRLDVAFETRVERDEVQAALVAALPGHRFAWRLEDDDKASTVQLVVVAAGSGRDEYGKRARIFANEKSLDRLYDRIEDAFGRDATFSEPRWAHGVEGATTLLAALTEAGKLDADTDRGRTIRVEAQRLFYNQSSNARREIPESFNPALQLAKSWRPAMRSSAPRDFAHVILSAKPGTDKVAFMDAARATLAREFAGHEYVFVMHTNRSHIHVHAAVRLTSPTGEKLHPGIQDFNRWRVTLAEEARERHIPMEAVRRFDQAHAPGYRLKDVRMTERGIAPDSVRRRVERVKNRDVHHPTREEGQQRAAEAAGHWSALAARGTGLPAVAPGAIRLFRAEAAGRPTSRAPLFSTDRAVAESYLSNRGAGQLVYVDVPADHRNELKPSHTHEAAFVVPRALSASSKPVEPIDEAAITPFRTRTEAALRDRPTEKRSMRTAETMETARQGMADALSRITAALPDGETRDDIIRQSKDLLEKAATATNAQRRLERTPGEMRGDRYVQPTPTDVGDLFTNERKGSDIHYTRHDAATGRYRMLAFVDKGKELDIKDWDHPPSVNAALKLASEKWDAITINGSDSYKETVARLAAEHGYKISNPEMQDRIKELQAHFEAQRATAQTEAKREPDLSGPATTTAAERAVELQSIRDRVDAEARRETGQATRAAAAHETNAATGSESAPYRSEQEARSAREAERVIDANPARPIPNDPAQSEAIQSLRHEQSQVLRQAERDEQRRIDVENVERFRAQERNRDRSEDEEQTR